MFPTWWPLYILCMLNIITLHQSCGASCGSCTTSSEAHMAGRIYILQLLVILAIFRPFTCVFRGRPYTTLVVFGHFWTSPFSLLRYSWTGTKPISSPVTLVRRVAQEEDVTICYFWRDSAIQSSLLHNAMQHYGIDHSPCGSLAHELHVTIYKYPSYE